MPLKFLNVHLQCAGHLSLGMSWKMGVGACFIEVCINAGQIFSGQPIGWLRYPTLWMGIGCFLFCLVFFLSPVAVCGVHIYLFWLKLLYNFGMTGSVSASKVPLSCY